jgi:ribosome-binding protein aMBF1 (putative translation factor)
VKQRVKSTQAKDPKRQRHSRQSIDELTDLVLRRVGRRIQRLREARGLSQDAFADQCGVHSTYLKRIERGESNLTMKTINILARNAGVGLSLLFKDLF